MSPLSGALARRSAVSYPGGMAKKTPKTSKPAPKTLRDEDVVTRPQRRPPGSSGVRVRTGLRGGPGNANNGEGHQQG